MMAVLIIEMLILVTGSIVSAVVPPPNFQVVRRLNPDETGPPWEDSFSNHGCSASTCPTYSTCASGNCCFCKCLYDYPNVVVNKTSVRCLNYGDTNRIPSAYCQYSFRNANEPLEVLPLIKAATGKIKFTSSSVRVDCSESNIISVDPWQYLDVYAEWKNGEGDVFIVDFNTVGGRDGNKKDLTFLKWSAQLDAKYAGLLIKFSLKCAGRDVGCILAKINGTHTYNPPATTTSPTTSLTTSATPEHTTTPAVVQSSSTDSSQTSPTVPSTTSAPAPSEHTTNPTTAEWSSSTDSSQTTVQQQTTVTLPPSPSGSVPPTFSMSPKTTAVPTQGRSPPVSKVPPGPKTTTAGAATKPAQQEAANGKTGASSSNKAVIPAVAVIAVLVGLICLVLLIVLYKRRNKRPAEKAPKDPEADSEAKLNDYQDPLYVELPNQQSAGACDNAIYCDPTEEQFQKRSKLDPLPALPVSESTYQPLNQHTRNIPDIPAPPPVSYPLIKNDMPEEPSDYVNPDREAPSDAADNDNSSIADYDNPSVTSVPPTDTQNVEKLNNESSDYDNPPVQGNNGTPTTNQNLELNNEAPDYDNPPVQGTPRESTDPLIPTSPSESVAETAQEAEPEYFELEPTDSSL